MRGLHKKSQVTIFIIIAIVIIVGLIAYFVLRGNNSSSIPRDIEPVYSYYLNCMDNTAKEGALILGQTGGYIENPNFSPGSEYMPFSSQLNFLGMGIPYWYYISGNGVIKEQVPTKERMQVQLNDYIKKNINSCNFDRFIQQGFVVNLGDVKEVDSIVNDNSIGVNVKQDIEIVFGNTTWTAKTHTRDVNSNLGKFYNLALKIYNHEKQSSFLENYGIDALRLYAPVDGTEISCSPKIWSVDEVRENLMNALEANTGAIKLKGTYYKLSKEENKYFVQDVGEKVSANVNFLYSRVWPTKMEISPSDSGFLKADPVGMQEGMGMLGFCYTTYHFVYDLGYPVLVQLYYNDEIFQFPMVVFIHQNQPRNYTSGQGLIDVVPELCKYKLTNMTVYTFNSNLNPVEANINFKCFDTSCGIGKTLIKSGEASLTAPFPQCSNGFIIATAQGYTAKKQIVSSINPGVVQIILDKKYKLALSVEGLSSDDRAIINFMKENGTDSISVSYPDQKQIELTEGQYEIKAYIYSNTNFNLKGSTTQKCVDAPSSGISGIFGATERKCFDMTVPDQVISSAVSGGGKEKYYIAESELQGAKSIIISPEKFGRPAKIEDLQINYNKIETSGLNIKFE
ncbi:Uncharacterised protein [uncultured archaeon]|nr:Uncharacterised protein [uncultured archaeon]